MSQDLAGAWRERRRDEANANDIQVNVRRKTSKKKKKMCLESREK